MALNEIGQLAGIAVLEEVEGNAALPRRIYYHARRDDPFDLSDKQFIRLNRLNKDITSELVDLLTPFMVAPSRVSDLTITNKILTASRFFGTGSYQLDVGCNINHAASQSSVSRSIEEVSRALNHPAVFNRYVAMPRNNVELERTYRGFHLSYNFPGIIGCLDCTHVAIYPPPVNDALYPEVLYVNRESYHSINVQLICDSNLQILNVCARYPGSTHDSFIWNNSAVLPYMQNLHHMGRRLSLLADSGYALRPWILTPVADALPNTPEARYNERQMSTRSLIERCNGLLKLRFRCLLKHRVLHYKPVKCSRIINSCVVLHNMCIEENLPLPQDGDDEGIEVDFGMYPPDGPEEDERAGGANRVNPQLAAGRLFRARLIRQHFAH